jgi:hypothetical protein
LSAFATTKGRNEASDEFGPEFNILTGMYVHTLFLLEGKREWVLI